MATIPVTPDTLARAHRLRVLIDTQVDTATGDMTRAWARLWNELAADWDRAIAQIIAADPLVHMTNAQLFRLTRVRYAFDVTLHNLERLSAQATTTIVARIPPVVEAGATRELGLIAAQLPRGAGVGLDTALGHAIEAITRRATEQVTSLARPLAPDAYQAMLAEVQRGVALGTNPKVAAARMLRRTKGEFDGGLTRATRIARTEMLDAHRAAAHATDQANADVLAGWQWNASLSPRTCPACLSMHGRIFPLDTQGPHGHVNCRCARLPVVKPWSALGYAVPEPPDAMPNAQAWFDRLPEARQLAIMGPTRLRLLRSGAVSWDDLAVEVQNPRWRQSWQPRTLADLRRRAVATA